MNTLFDNLIGQHKCVNEQEARDLCLSYQNLNQKEKAEFVKYIVVKHKDCEKCTRDTIKKSTFNQGESNLLRRSLVKSMNDNELNPIFEEIFIHILRLDIGAKFVIDMRAELLDLLPLLHSDGDLTNSVRSLSNGLREKLSLLFQVGSLSLDRVTWDSSHDMLQKLYNYEAVHPMKNWVDLKRRVGPYRRCYVYTHKSTDREPLVVLYTALMDEISANINSIIGGNWLDHDKNLIANIAIPYQMETPEEIQAAVFYSVYSTQKGLRGIDLGNMLIKQVVRSVIDEFPHIMQFSTLSPIPGFREWLLMELKKGHSVLSSCIMKDTVSHLNKNLQSHGFSDIWSALSYFIKTNNWIYSSDLNNLFRLPLLRMCAHYLCKEKRRSYALNSVAHFHLRNGAVLWRLNWNADTSTRGLNDSCGIMANYRYYLDETEINSKNYAENHLIVISQDIRNLLTVPIQSSL